MLFCRRDAGKRELVRDYENKLFDLWNQCCILRNKNRWSVDRIAELEQDYNLHAQECSAIEQRHAELMRQEYEKRDILESKYLILHAENEMLRQDIEKYRRDAKKNKKEKKTLKEIYRRMREMGRLLRMPAEYWEAVFDAAEYVKINPDISRKFLGSEKKLLRHFILYGMEEGRKGNSSFDPWAYMEYNPDVAEYYKGDKTGCYLHYIEFGKKEGRRTCW